MRLLDTSQGTYFPPQPYLEGIGTAQVLTYFEPLLGGNPLIKVFRHDQLDTMGLTETSSGTSCPLKPHLED